jgi:hypothetical protein
MSEQPPDDDVESDPVVQRVHAWLHADGTLAGEDVERVMSLLHNLSDRRSVRVRGLVGCADWRAWGVAALAVAPSTILRLGSRPEAKGR